MSQPEPTSSTPLLPGPGVATTQDHPIFLRACHSPWSWLPQGALVSVRGAILAHLTTLAFMLLDYKVYKREDGDTAWRIIFQFSTVTFVLLWFYHLLTFCWSFTHLYYPDVEDDDNTWESNLLRSMSPPSESYRKRIYFSLFFSVVHVYAFLNALVFWTVLVPQGHGHLPGDDNTKKPSEMFRTSNSFEDFFSDGWFEQFCVLNLWGVTAIIAFVEIIFLNSIKRPVPVGTHIFGISFFLALYLAWAGLGFLFTGRAPYFWMDLEIMGRKEVVAAYCSGFVGLGPLIFSFIYGLIGMRENLTKKDDAKDDEPAAALVPA